MLYYAGVELFWISVILILPVVCVILWQKYQDRKVKTYTVIDLAEFRKKIEAANMPQQSFGFKKPWYDAPSTEYISGLHRDDSIFKTVEEFRNELNESG